jgi:Na+-driven multidrug efflux pump
VVGTIGAQSQGSFVNFMACWVIAASASYYFAFVAGYGLRGIWMALILKSFVSAIGYLMIVESADWDKIIMKAKLRI